MKTILAIALGGALGSVMRYGVNFSSMKLLGAALPWGTFFVNVAGSLLIGILTGLFALAWQPSPEIRAFLITGVLGGFTTFSAFSLDTASLLENGAAPAAIVYAILSVTVSLAALFGGLAAVRLLAA